MEDDSPRARVLGMLKVERGMDAATVSALCDGGRFCAGAVDGGRALSAHVALDCGCTGAGRRRLSRMARSLFRRDVRRGPRREAAAMASRAPL